MELICTLLTLYWLILFARIAMSWFPITPGGLGERVYGVLYSLTEPLMRPLRGLLPAVRMGGAGLDLSPLLLFAAIVVLRGVIC